MTPEEIVLRTLNAMQAVKFWMFIGAAFYFLLVAFKLYRKENDSE